jgi:DNA polymerase elongation subunit (family B)
MSPGQIRKLAREIGMNDADIANEPIIKIKETKTETAAVRETTKENEPKIELASMVEKTNVKAEKPKVVKTVEAKASNRKETVKPVEKRSNPEAVKVVKDGGSRPRVITVAKLR